MFRQSKKKCISLLLSIMLVMALSGCGKDASLEEYKKAMEVFYAKIVLVDEGMNVLNGENDPEGSKLLEYLDELNLIVQDMAELEVPKEFSSVESLADEASENMSHAAELYHQLYSGEGYDENIASAAYEYYERANLRIRYITEILHGELPDEYVPDEGGTVESIDFDESVDLNESSDFDESVGGEESVDEGSPDEGSSDDIYYYDSEE